jgi:putative nucleotidyltransferase with HDIG domain
MLSYSHALEILRKYSKGEVWANHCIAVGKVAAAFAPIFAEKCNSDSEFLQAAALLHDIGRYKTHDPVLHGVEGYWLLNNLGFPSEAFVCASHIFYGLNKTEAALYGLPEEDFFPRSFEERLIPLVDFLVEFDRATTLDDRFTSLRSRNNGNDFFLAKLDYAQCKAGSFMSELNQEFDISMEAVAFQALA